MTVCNTFDGRYRGATLNREVVFPLWLAADMARVELSRHPTYAAWEIDEYDIDINEPSPYEAMVQALI